MESVYVADQTIQNKKGNDRVVGTAWKNLNNWPSCLIDAPYGL